MSREDLAILLQFQRRHNVEQIFCTILLRAEIPPEKTSNILEQIFGGMPGAEDSNTPVKRCYQGQRALLVFGYTTKKTRRPLVFGYTTKR